MDKKLIVGRYENRSDIQCLRIVGPFSKEVSDKILNNYYPYSCKPQEGEIYGQASFLVKSEDDCLEFVKKLKPVLEEQGYNLEYRGLVAVPPEKLSSLEKPNDLFKLVNETLIGESLGKIKPSKLVVLDYQKTLERLTQ